MKQWFAVLLAATACHTAGSTWMAQPLPDDDWSSAAEGPESAPPKAAHPAARTVGPARTAPASVTPPPVEPAKLEGRVLGKFRNTYYDFPSEADHEGDPVALRSAKCNTIKMVPRGFHDAVCVQGSGLLASGATVSFAKRDCACAELCPRTQQKICFDELDRERFPWGRGALGQAITPLLTVAVDDTVIPMGSAVFIPELVGMPMGGGGQHDGCFVAQDRGMKVKGEHVDIFTGSEAVTKVWNQAVPSNRGVTVVLDSPRCERAPSE